MIMKGVSIQIMMRAIGRVAIIMMIQMIMVMMVGLMQPMTETRMHEYDNDDDAGFDTAATRTTTTTTTTTATTMTGMPFLRCASIVNVYIYACMV